MKRKPLVILFVVSCTLCGASTCLAGAALGLFGFLADKRQLMLDTGLDRGALMTAGLAGLLLGVISLAAAFWLWRRKKGRE